MYGNHDVDKVRALCGDMLPDGEDDDDGSLADNMMELLLGADSVYTLDWESDGPGASAGTERVVLLCERYFTLSYDFGPGGPYDTMLEALQSMVSTDEHGNIRLGPATCSIDCSQWSTDELLLQCDLYKHTPAHGLDLNGRYWTIDQLRDRQRVLRSALPTS
jgi:hypothetical protein